MIPQRFRKQKEKVATPPELQRLFVMYEQNKMSERDLINLLRGEADVHPEYVSEIRERVLRIIKKLQRDFDAREACKSDTGIAAIPSTKDRKIEW